MPEPIKGNTPEERLVDALVKRTPYLFRDEFGVVLYKDLPTNTLQMVEIRLFDVSDVPRNERRTIFL